jgi:hypothetical protein
MFMMLLINQIYFSRHYYADIDKTRREVERMIEKGEWDTKEFTDMREKLLKVLQINHDPIDNMVILKKLEKLDDKKLDKLTLEELEKSYYEKLVKLEKSEKLEKLEKLNELLKKNI